MEPKKISPAITAVIVIVLIGLVTTAIIILNNKTNTVSTTETTGTNSTGTTTSNGTYKDGTYSASGAYSTPDGRESIKVTVTIANNVITNAAVTQNAFSGESRQYQAGFASGYKSLVVGKNIDSVSLSRVAGSSLTSNGFNKAIDQIKTDAAV